MDPKRNTPRHILIKLSKIKDKDIILKAAREKKRVTYKGVLIKLSADFSKETLEARREWKEISIKQSYHLEWKGRLNVSQTKLSLKSSSSPSPYM